MEEAAVVEAAGYYNRSRTTATKARGAVRPAQRVERERPARRVQRQRPGQRVQRQRPGRRVPQERRAQRVQELSVRGGRLVQRLRPGYRERWAHDPIHRDFAPARHFARRRIRPLRATQWDLRRSGWLSLRIQSRGLGPAGSALLLALPAVP